MDWISVSDKLPEDDLPQNTKTLVIEVLVCVNNGWREIRTAIRERLIISGSPRDDTCTYTPWKWLRDAQDITHWMPLPEPPAEGTL